MAALELTGELLTGAQPVGRVGVGEGLSEAAVDGVALADGQISDDVAALVGVMPNSA